MLGGRPRLKVENEAGTDPFTFTLCSVYTTFHHPDFPLKKNIYGVFRSAFQTHLSNSVF
jgi:hypothetical protein